MFEFSVFCFIYGIRGREVLTEILGQASFSQPEECQVKSSSS